MGRHFYALARADDPRPVLSSRAPKSLGSERTLNVDVGERREIEFHLRKSAEAVARRLRRQSYLAQGVRIKLKRPDFHLLTRQHGLAEPTDLASELFRVAASLLRDVREPGPFRLIGLAAYDLIRGADWAQPSLPIEQTARARRLETALDRVSERFGAGAVQRAADLLRDGGIGVSVNLDFLDQGEEDSESRD
jgi:DNA polymerase-4